MEEITANIKYGGRDSTVVLLEGLYTTNSPRNDRSRMAFDDKTQQTRSERGCHNAFASTRKRARHGKDDEDTRTNGFDSLRKRETLHSSLENGDSLADHESALSYSASLEEVRTWLGALCEEEQVQADWSDEYEHQVGGHTKSHGDIDRGLDTSVLSRIRK
jgi:hypothetical protein